MNGMFDSLIDDRGNATFNDVVRGSVHILLCGHSTAHVKEIAEKTSPIHIELLTSKELYDSSNDLLLQLKLRVPPQPPLD